LAKTSNHHLKNALSYPSCPKLLVIVVEVSNMASNPHGWLSRRFLSSHNHCSQIIREPEYENCGFFEVLK
jgi:hypothetical protein